MQLIFRMAASGMGQRLIARRLNERKVPTFNETTPAWAHSTGAKDPLQPVPSSASTSPTSGVRVKRGNGTKINGESLQRVPDGPPRLASSRPSSRKASGPKPTRPCPPGERSTNEARWLSPNPEAARRYSQSVRRSGHRREHGASHALAGQRQALPPEAGYRFERRECSHPEHIVNADFEAAFLTWLDHLDWSSVTDTADSEESCGTRNELAN